jgi:hypothetical protein
MLDAGYVMHEKHYFYGRRSAVIDKNPDNSDRFSLRENIPIEIRKMPSSPSPNIFMLCILFFKTFMISSRPFISPI